MAAIKFHQWKGFTKRRLSVLWAPHKIAKIARTRKNSHDYELYANLFRKEALFRKEFAISENSKEKVAYLSAYG